MTDLTDNPFEASDVLTAGDSAQPAGSSSSPDATGPPPVTNTGMPSTTPPAANLGASPPPQPTPQHERETVNDPGVIALRGMFPDYDDLIL